MGDESRSGIEELENQGWVRQFVASEPRLSEAAALYTELGFEVHLEPLPKGQECATCSGTEGHEESGDCRVCFEGFEDQYKIIFTRRRNGSEKESVR
jgi:hypothetical protein